MARFFQVDSVYKKIFPATHTFRDDTVDSAPSGWTTNNGSGASTTIIASQSSHNKVLKCVSSTGAYDIEIDFSATQGTGKIDIWFETSDNTQNNYLQLLNSVDTVAIQVDLNAIAGVGDNTMYHYSINFDCTPDTYDHYLDGSVIASGVAFDTGVDNILTIKFKSTAGQSVNNYVDAIGFSWDSNYTWGDNIFWKNLKDSMAQANFEAEELYTTSTSINFVDSDESVGGANTTVTIIPSFDEQKKILEFYDNDGTNFAGITNNFASARDNGTIEFYIETTNATLNTQFIIYSSINIGIRCRIHEGYFKYRDVSDVWQNIAVAAANTRYHIKLEFDCDGGYKGLTADHFYIWINNVRYGEYEFNIVQADLDNIKFRTAGVDSNYYFYIDAVGYSWENDYEEADNRTFDYNDNYTREDITTSIIDVRYNNILHGFRNATIITTEEFEHSEVFFQVEDINNILAIEGEIKNRYQTGPRRSYTLRDKNYDDLAEPITNTFSSDKIHDPADSTCLLKTALPNVDHTEGDLLLSTADPESSTYSPTLRNYPTGRFLRDISDLGDTVTIIKANGIVFLDDDRASGDFLDFDTEADRKVFGAAPRVNDILEDFNYFEIFGAINPDTGERFSKVIDNSGNDKKIKWRIVNNNFRSQPDLDNYAIALQLRITSLKIITLVVQGLGVHNMGETFNLKYVTGNYNIPQADYYIVGEKFRSMANNTAILTLSEGLIEESKYSSTFEKTQEYADTFASEIYETDIDTISINMYPGGGAAWSAVGVEMDALNETVNGHFYLDNYVDPDRALVITLLFRNGGNGADIIDGELDVIKLDADGSYTADGIVANENMDITFTEDNGYETTSRTISASALENDHIYFVVWKQKEGAKTIYCCGIQITMYKKRIV